MSSPSVRVAPSAARFPWLNTGSPAARRLLAGAVAAGAALVLLALCAYYARTAPFVDFEAYRAGAQALRDGSGLYARGFAWRDAGYAVNHPSGPPPVEGLPYVYPPAFAMALLPFTMLPLRVASLVWLALLMGSLLGTSAVLARTLVPAARHRVALPLGITAVLVVFQPVRASLVTGQADCLLLLLLALSLAAVVAGRQGRAGLFLALAASIKPTLALLLLFYLWKRAYRAVVVCCLVGAALLLLPMALLGPRPVLDFFAVAGYWSSPSFAVSPVNQSPYGFLLRLFTPNAYTVPFVAAPLLVTVLRLALVAVVLGGVAVAVQRTWRVPAGQLGLELGLAVTAMLLVAPLSEDVQYIYLAVPFGATAAALLGRPRGRRPGAAPGGPVALLAGLATVYAYLSLPKLSEVKFAFYAHYLAPIAGAKVLLTGAHLYGLCAFVAVSLLALCWYRRALGDGPLGDPAAPAW
jgi:alpha-1,2-mannosyltransferase